jgi:hypothetical protein
MKNIVSYLMIFILTVIGCMAQQNTNENDENSVLNFYRQYSEYTDPGEYVYLYENLPDSLPELCRLIKSQSIHPFAELPKYREQIPKERWDWFGTYPTVHSVLEGLLSYDSSGFNPGRKVVDRLVLICRHNSLLLASILKHRGIPVKVRYGYATYLIADFHTGHIICEVWNEDEKRWMLVDPTTAMVDFSREKFDFSNDAWLQLQNQEIDPSLYGVPPKHTGLASILGNLCSDLASVLGIEYPVNHYAPIVGTVHEEDKELTTEQVETLNKISELMKSVDAENLAILQEIYINTPEIQITKTFEFQSRNSQNSGETKGK